MTCESCLEQMNEIGESLNHDHNDHHLLESYETHRDRWNNVRSHLDEMHLRLEELPEKWKLYNERWALV